jgi:hypothetical protein
MATKGKFKKRSIIGGALLLLMVYVSLVKLTTPDTTPSIVEVTKLLKQVPWVNGFEQMDSDNEVWVSADERGKENPFVFWFLLPDSYHAGVEVKYISTDDIYRRRVVTGVSEANSEFVLRVPKGRVVKVYVSFGCRMLVRSGIAPLFNKNVFMKCSSNESNFRYDINLRDDEFAKALEGDVLKSGGLYLGEDINVRFPRARKTVKLLKNAAIENNGKYAGMPLL